MSGQFIKDTPELIVVSSGISARNAWRAVAVGLVLLGIFVSIPWGEDNESGFSFGIFIFMFLFALWPWQGAEQRTKIQFNLKPGYITVTYQRWTILGSWWFLKATKNIPMTEINRATIEDAYALIRTGDMISGVTNYFFKVPAGDGTTFEVWHDHDPEVIRHLAMRFAEAVEKYTNASKP